MRRPGGKLSRLTGTLSKAQLLKVAAAGADPAPVACGIYQDGHSRRMSFWSPAGKAPSKQRALDILRAVEGDRPLARSWIDLGGETLDEAVHG